MNNSPNFLAIRKCAQEIRDMMGDDEDAQAFWDTLDGLTDAADILDALIEADQDAAATAEAISARIKAATARRDRIARRSDAARKMMLAVLDAAGMKKAERPLATVSRRAGSLSVKITDDASVPSQLCTVKTVTTPDKNAIRAQIEDGVAVPGAVLERGPDGVTVRFS